MTDDRRKSDSLFKIIFFLLAIIQAIALAWVSKIDSKAEKIPVLEANLTNLRTTVMEIRDDVKILLKNRR